MGEQKNIVLYRDSLSTSWGFRLHGGVDYGTSLIVQKVQPLTAAEGELLPGDRVLAVDGKDVSDATHAQATDMIVMAGGRIQITVLRNVSSPWSIGSTPSSSTSSNNSSSRFDWASYKTNKDDDETEIPQNRQLAGLMKHAVDMKQHGQLGQLKVHATNQGYRTLPQFRQAKNNVPKQDITSYLPKPPPRGKILNAGSRGSTPTIAENSMRHHVRSSLLRSPTGSVDSGRSTPTSVLEMPGTGTSNQAVGVWTPPAHDPNKRLVHMQYNSPMNLYNPHNVANMVQIQTGQKLSWIQKPRVRFLEDITDSPTYQFIQEMETGVPTRGRRAQSVDQYPQSNTLNHLTTYFSGGGRKPL